MTINLGYLIGGTVIVERIFSIAGVGSLLLASEVAFNIVKTVGALYLIYLDLAQWRAKVKEGTEVEVAARAVAPSVKRRLLSIVRWAGGRLVSQLAASLVRNQNTNTSIQVTINGIMDAPTAPSSRPSRPAPSNSPAATRFAT